MEKKKRGRPKGFTLSAEVREKMRLAQQKRMEEGRHNFAVGHPLYGGGIVVNMEGKPSPRKGKKNTPEHVAKVIAKARLTWDTPEYKEKKRQAALGKKQSASTIQKRKESRAGYRHSEATRRKISETQRAKKEQHHAWKGGVSAINDKLRRSIDFKLWREAVFARDDWTCQFCGQRGGILHPDHIKPFATYPELRFDINNGRTLCKECHMSTDTWGKNKPRSVTNDNTNLDVL